MVECYGEQEQSSGLTVMVAQELAFPFFGKVIGEWVQVADTFSSTYDPLGLDLVVVHSGKRFAISAHSVELVSHCLKAASFWRLFSSGDRDSEIKGIPHEDRFSDRDYDAEYRDLFRKDSPAKTRLGLLISQVVTC